MRLTLISAKETAAANNNEQDKQDNDQGKTATTAIVGSCGAMVTACMSRIASNGIAYATARHGRPSSFHLFLLLRLAKYHMPAAGGPSGCLSTLVQNCTFVPIEVDRPSIIKM